MVPVQQATIEANGDQWTLTPETYISNGPLKMIEWVPGSHITFAKNENYWNTDKVTVNTFKVCPDGRFQCRLQCISDW